MTRLIRILLFFPLFINANIIETDQFSDIFPFVTENSLVIFDIDETLLESNTSLGSSTWRQTIRKIYESDPDRDLNYSYYDLLVIYVERQVPKKPLEPNIPDLIEKMKEIGAKVVSLTARSIDHEHYQTPVCDQGEAIYQFLVSIGIDFYQEKPSWISKSYHKGILFSDHNLKGPFFIEQLEYASQLPSKIIFVDDKLKHVESMEKELQNFDIPSTSIWYRYSALHSKQDFDFLVSAVQLDYLFKSGVVLDEEQASEIAESLVDVDSKEYTLRIIQENLEFLIDFYEGIGG